MRLGLLGGTFDPVHFGHLLLAEQCREQCVLDEIWFLPTGSPPHKTNRTISSGQTRAEMLELAIAGHSDFSVCRMEIEREGTTYSVETLQQLSDEDEERELFFLIGADSLADLPSWREPARIFQLATIVAVNRGEKPLPDTSALVAKIGEKPVGNIQFVNMPAVESSSSEIRLRVREKRSIRYMVPPAVEMYVREHRLYSE